MTSRRLGLAASAAASAVAVPQPGSSLRWLKSLLRDEYWRWQRAHVDVILPDQGSLSLTHTHTHTDHKTVIGNNLWLRREGSNIERLVRNEKTAIL